MIVLDTSGLLAALDRSQRHHQAAARALAQASGDLLLSPFVLAELDYMLATRVGSDATLDLLEDVADGAYTLAPFDAHDIVAAQGVMRSYRDHDLGLTDASIVMLADRHGTRDLLTLDERHFRVLRAAGDQPFRLYPADKPA